MKISVSQIKMFCSSKQKRAGKYILGVEEDIVNDNFIVGTAFENWLTMGNEKIEEVIGNSKVEDLGKIIADLDGLKQNAEGFVFEKGICQLKVEGELFGHKIEGYIDNITDERIEDIKTSHYVSDLASDSISMFSGLSKYDEYGLQLWIYMLLTGKSKARILEFAKHKYKDGRSARAVFEFYMTDEFNKKMEDKFKPIIDDMFSIYKKFEGKISQ